MALAVGCGAVPNATDQGDGGDFIETADGAIVHNSDGSTGGSDGSGPKPDGAVVGSDAGGGGRDAGGAGQDAGGVGQDSGGGGIDSGGGGGPITCPGPGNYKHNGSACGSERWEIKTGTDPYTGQVSLVPKSNTIAALIALPAAGGGTLRSSPIETTLWELKDVTLSMIKLETDSDYHMVISDGPHTMIAEIAYPNCATGSPWSCFLSRARAEVDARLNVTSSPQYPALTVTLRGVGFFDASHGQTGVAPNAVELHPVLQICFGQGCTPS